MDTKSINICVFLLIMIIILSIYNNYYKVEQFGIMDVVQNPGRWVGNQVGEVWRGIKGPAVFTRDIYYNMFPNYTMVTRYFDKKNDFVRANKGLPLTRPLSGKLNFRFAKLDKNKNYSLGLGSSPTIGSSILSKLA